MSETPLSGLEGDGFLQTAGSEPVSATEDEPGGAPASGAALTRVKSMAPSWTCSITAFSSPSWADG